jgi:hypothetical protein
VSKQEPVAYRYAVARLNPKRPEWHYTITKTRPDSQPLYAAPQWVELTEEEIDATWRSVAYTVPYRQFRIDIARAIEAKLREKNQ